MASAPNSAPSPSASITARVLLVGLPPVLLCLVLLVTADMITPLRWTLAAGVLAWWLLAAISLSHGISRPLETLTSVVCALREGEYATRARASGHPGPLADALTATNELALLLDRHRLEVSDATTLLQRIMDEVDVAVIGIDEHDRVALCNRVAGTLLRSPAPHGRTAVSLHIVDWLRGTSPRIVEPPCTASSRWQLRRAELRQGGRPFRLLVLSDLGKVLDDEARRSAFKVVRVLSHEVNNSLAPIGSVAEALASRIKDDADEDQQRLRRNLTMIAERAESLGRFLGAFAELAKLPPPAPEPMRVGPWVHRVAALETRVRVHVHEGPDVVVQGDAVQLERALINLVDNAVDACAQSNGGVHVSWAVDDGHGHCARIVVHDEGTGLLDAQNLFVPLYTTKPGGAGIGLALSREIVRGLGGELTLENRGDTHGCAAVMTLPLVPGPPPEQRRPGPTRDVARP